MRLVPLLFFALLAARAAEPDKYGCPAGYFFWQADGTAHCQICQPGCACAGGWQQCVGCDDGHFSGAAGAAACTPCPPGTTSDALYNGGCDPQNILTPCANAGGPLGQVACRPDPPPARIDYVAPSGTLSQPLQYLSGGPPYIPVKVPPYYDIDLAPMIQQSY